MRINVLRGSLCQFDRFKRGKKGKIGKIVRERVVLQTQHRDRVQPLLRQSAAAEGWALTSNILSAR